MSIWERKYFSNVERTDVDTTELDYLSSTLHKINLTTVEYFTVDASTEHRPDLISLRWYGTYHLGWLIGIHNNIEDLTEGFYIGRKIAIPSIDEYYRFQNRNTRARNERI